MFSKNCVSCKKSFIAKDNRQKSCSRSCSVKKTNRNRADSNRNFWTKRSYCNNCLIPIKRKKSQFCGNKCQQIFNVRERVIQSEMGNEPASHITYRFYLIHSFGAKCMLCGWDKINLTSKKVPIEMNHVDGNSTNTKLDNLELICPNCHSLTPHYKGLNKGKGRASRMVRYNEGKSW